MAGPAKDSANPWDPPAGKELRPDGEAGDAADRSKRDALFGELQRIDEATSTRLLLFLTHQMIDFKFRFVFSFATIAS